MKNDIRRMNRCFPFQPLEGKGANISQEKFVPQIKKLPAVPEILHIFVERVSRLGFPDRGGGYKRTMYLLLTKQNERHIPVVNL